MRLTDFTGTFVQIIKGKTDSWLIVELDGRVRLSAPESQARKAALGLMRPASGVRTFPGVVFLKYGGGIFENIPEKCGITVCKKLSNPWRREMIGFAT